MIWVLGYVIANMLVSWFMTALALERANKRTLVEIHGNEGVAIFMGWFALWPITTPIALWCMFGSGLKARLPGSPMRWLVREILNARTNVKGN